MRDREDIEETLHTYSDMIYRLCVCRLKSRADSEDAFQEVFLKYAKSKESFTSEEHKKAWLIRITINICHDSLRRNFWKKNCPLEEMLVEPSIVNEEDTRMINLIRSLPGKYQEVLIMHYYEGYSAIEIGQLLDKNVNTIYSLLKRGRDLLKKDLGGDLYEE